MKFNDVYRNFLNEEKELQLVTFKDIAKLTDLDNKGSKLGYKDEKYKIPGLSKPLIIPSYYDDLKNFAEEIMVRGKKYYLKYNDRKEKFMVIPSGFGDSDDFELKTDGISFYFESPQMKVNINPKSVYKSIKQNIFHRSFRDNKLTAYSGDYDLSMKTLETLSKDYKKLGDVFMNILEGYLKDQNNPSGEYIALQIGRIFEKAKRDEKHFGPGVIPEVSKWLSQFYQVPDKEKIKIMDAVSKNEKYIATTIYPTSNRMGNSETVRFFVNENPGKSKEPNRNNPHFKSYNFRDLEFEYNGNTIIARLEDEQYYSRD
jgi:hypothetical protein